MVLCKFIPDSELSMLTVEDTIRNLQKVYLHISPVFG